MKKTSIFLILATVVAMMFTGCNQIVGEDKAATLEDYRGTWTCKVGTDTELTLTIDGRFGTLTGLPSGDRELFCSVENGLLTAVTAKAEQFNMTINPLKTTVKVSSKVLNDDIKNFDIFMNKKLDLSAFIIDGDATFNDFVGTWSGSTKDGKNLEFTFSIEPLTGVFTGNVKGFAEEILTGYVVCTKGLALFKARNESLVFSMYINKNHDRINVTGAATLSLKK